MRFKTLLLVAHTLLAAYAVFAATLNGTFEICGVVLGSLVLIYSAIIGYWLATRQSPAQLAGFTPLCVLFFYLAFFLKMVLLVQAPERFFSNGWIAASPLAAASPDVWLRSFALFVMSQAVFLIGASIGKAIWNVRLTRRETPSPAFVGRLLMLSLLLIAYRVFVVAVLRVGHIGAGDVMLFGLPYLTGIVVFLSQWTTLSILAYTCTEAILSRRRYLTAAGVILPFLFGAASVCWTSSKQELLLPALVVSVIAGIHRQEFGRFARRIVVCGVVGCFVATLLLYQILAHYRYTSDTIGFIEFLSANSHMISPSEASLQLLDRLTGLEGLAVSQVYVDAYGPTFRAVMDPQFSYTTDVWGVPYDAHFGMEIGLLGSLLITGGPLCVLFAMLVFGVLCSAFEIDGRARSGSAVTTAEIGVGVSFLVLTLLGGPPLMLLKRFFFLMLGIIVIRVLHRWGHSYGRTPVRPVLASKWNASHR